MKKILIALIALILGGVVAFAGQVYDREVVTYTNTGTVDWVNDYQYAAIKLVRIWNQSSLATSNALAVVMVTADGLYTQTVAAVQGVAPFSQATFTAGYLKAGDTLRITSTPATGGVAIVEFEVQQH